MPNLPTHLNLASKVARRLGHPTVELHLGSFLLGSTSPDIRIMTKWKRDSTHFAPLNIERVGAGAEGLFQAHPGLADPSRVTDATKAFLSGYLTHLMADETWILDIYRPYFDGDQQFSDHVRANIFDRALQLDMDKMSRDELGDMDEVRSVLDGSESGVGVGFISSETLGRWREWVADFLTWEFSWDRLRFATQRMYRDDPAAIEIVEEFLQCIPGSLEYLYDKIPGEKISSFREKVIEGSVRLIKEYLSAPESDQGGRAS